ncbi:MAG: poly-gamma-glutamate system protein [Lachnospiraceae bacterium]|nr:poly-gamma-glutamate system protein [Lachnospiraceae bacterium]
MSRRGRIALLSASLLLAGIILSVSHASVEVQPFWEQQLAARKQMEQCMVAILGYREALSIPLSSEDLCGTGLIGEEFTPITTSRGMPEAKRTAADPDMAALLVCMLYEAGIRPGDCVGAGFSGSFPGINLAVLCACDAMDVRLILISSVGASSYGANDPRLTFPEIIHRLYLDGLIRTDSVLVTPGGDFDNGRGVLDEALFDSVMERIADSGLIVLREPDYQENLAVRRAVYEKAGIDVFIASGGNISTTGIGAGAAALGQGVLKRRILPRPLTKESGLVEIYLLNGLPVINLLNIRQIAASYGLPFDPQKQAAPMEAAVYYQTRYPSAPLLVSLLLSLLLLSAIPVAEMRRKKQALASLAKQPV